MVSKNFIAIFSVMRVAYDARNKALHHYYIHESMCIIEYHHA